ncbi:hypothetical protein FXN61_29905 [Lentzea sp. PSKA42]|uniref:Avirulence D protein (AvrD) n=1 Tax=Lentzea indica TaxID=2604800 RepID=A0ABX1FP37_9PSEU|nr:AvrD family protein [Lentzea indica]NKE60773.1 hypothetical protein [Lentzea indica]
MGQKKINYPSIDDHLGAGSGRYFGAGYRRVEHSVHSAVVDRDNASVEASAVVGYPVDWSTKSSRRKLVPHLSTIDAAVLSVVLAEAYLTSTFALNDDQRRTMWLRRMVIKAGNKPQEQLEGFRISANHRETTGRPDGTSVSVLDSQLGGLRTRVEVVHDEGRHICGSGREALPDDLLGDPDRRYYANGFRAHQQRIADVALDLDATEVSGRVQVTGEVFPDGFAGAYQPGITVVDGMIVLAQLAQSLLYHVDDIRRGDSNTLWMRQVDFTAGSPHQRSTEFRTSTSITRSRLLGFDGGTWRTSDWTADFAGLRYAYRLAHRLPAETRLAVSS